MKIEGNEAVCSFLKRCRRNLGHDELNRFLDRPVTPGREAYVKKQLKQAGAQEFTGDPDQWPSLFLSSKAWRESPYHQAVTEPLLANNGSRYQSQWFAGGRLFNYDAVQPDQERELGDWMKLRAMDEDIETLVLCEENTEWMLDAPSEMATNDPYAAKAHGSVITFGLGIGYFLFLALRNPEVRHITVIEKDPQTIERFEELLKPLFPDQDRFSVRCEDAFAFWKEENLREFDYIYADIWQSSEDGLWAMRKLLKQYNPPLERADFWIEDSCIVPLRTLIDLYYEKLVSGKKTKVHPDYVPLLEDMRSYFESIPDTVTDPEQLKYYLYDRKVLRSILGGETCA